MADTRHEKVIALFVDKGWTLAQATGLAANFKAESDFNPAAVGDGGKAYGIGQWHPDRQAEFAKAFGKDIRGSSLEDQIAFADYELRKGREQVAGTKLAQAQDPGSAAAIVTAHYERPADTKGESLRRAQIAAGWAGVALPMGLGATERGLEATNDYPVLPVAGQATKGAGKAAIEAGSMDTAVALAQQLGAGTSLEAQEAATAQGQARNDAEAAKATAAGKIGFGDKFSTALRDPSVMPTWAILDRVNAEPSQRQPGENYLAEKDRLEAGLQDHEREYVRENWDGKASEPALQAQLTMRRDNAEQYGAGSGFSTFLAQSAAGLMDPASLMAGVAVGKAFTVAKLGHASYAAAGRPVAAGLSLMAESAAGNVAVEGIADAMGEVKTSSDYVLAGLAGAVLAAPFAARGMFAKGSSAHIEAEGTRLNDAAVAEQMNAVRAERAADQYASDTEIARRVEDKELRNVSDSIQEAVQPTRIREAVVPESVANAVRAEYESPTLVRDEPLPELDVQEPPVVDAATGAAKQEPAVKIDPNNIEGPTVEPPGFDAERDAYAAALGLQAPAPLMRPELAAADRAPTTYKLPDREVPVLFESDVDRAAWQMIGANDEQFKKLGDFMRNAGITPKAFRQLTTALDAHLNKAAQQTQPGDVLHFQDSRVWENPDKLVAQPKAVDADARTNPAVRQPPLSLSGIKHAKDVADRVLSGKEVIRALPGKAGEPLSLHWKLKAETVAANKGQGTLGQVLKHVVSRPETPSYIKRIAKYLDGVISDDVRAVSVRMSKDTQRPLYQADGPYILSGGSKTARDSFEANLDGISDYHMDALIHEMVHAATHSKIEAYRSVRQRMKLAPNLRQAMVQFESLHERFKKNLPQFYADNPHLVASNKTGAGYATENLHEFAAMLLTDKETRDVLVSMPGRPVAGRASNMWREMIGVITKMLSSKVLKDNAWVEGSRLLDTIIQADGSNIKYVDGVKAVMAPSGPVSLQGQLNAARTMTAHAKDWLTRNPVNPERLKVLSAKVSGALTDGLVLASSKNPIAQMVAGLVTETTTGAAGRSATVAIRTKMLHSKLLGDAVPEYSASYEVWKKANGGSWAEDLFKGDKRREFDKAVYTEVLNRRGKGYVSAADPAVIEAADRLEGLYKRAGDAQRDAATLGSANIPTSPVGYIPQALDGTKLQALTIADERLVTGALSDQFQARMGWDKAFADLFAPYYLDRVRRRAQGDKGLDGLAMGGDSSQVIRDTLEEMAFDPALVNRGAAMANQKLGLGQTKGRLDLDLQQTLRPGLQLMDVYVTDPLLLARTYVKRTAGTVALTESGIHGIRGVRELRRNMQTPVNTGEQVTAKELAAYDRVMAETLGTPSAGDVVSAGASNLQLLVQLQRLGGLVFQQSAEAYNMMHHLGLRSLLNGVSSLPQMMGEVGRLKKGQASGNHILTSIEQYGGEIGTEAYKMVAPLDAPDGRLGEYMDQPGVASRLLRAGGHLQSKVSGFRALMGAQHRMVAEQIVLKAIRFIRDGGEDIALRDMGITKEVQLHMLADQHRTTQFDASGRVTSFDLSQVSDPRVAEAFVQAVHRGTSQIIQGAFIGEKNAWFHNDYLRLLLQLRTFGLLSAEKQWGRARMNHGYASAAGLVLAQMALSLPIHLARIQAASVGRDDRDKFLKDNLNPAALVKATMNYSSMSGMSSDVLELLTGIAGGWADKDTKEALGVRANQGMGVGKIVPAAGTIDNLVKVASGRSDRYTVLKQLPFSNLWYMLPVLNLAKHD